MYKCISNFISTCDYGVKIVIIEGPLGRAHRRPAIYDRRELSSDMRRRACY